jgi:phosphatidate cytidylyltransferase
MDNANAASAASPVNKGSLTSRVISAFALLPVIAVLVWWSVWSVAAAVVVATVISLRELYDAFAAGHYQPRVGLGLCVALALVFSVALQPFVAINLLELVLTGSILVTLIVELPRHDHAGRLPAWALTLAGAIYIGWLLSHFILLRGLRTPLSSSIFTPLGIQPGAAWVYMVLAITFIQDTAAYFVGRSMGRHKMAPLLSPKKTWEGAAGGLVGSVTTSLVCIPLLGLPLTLGAGIVIGLVGGVVGPLGDLAESLIKRQVGLKDAGSIIPGHGGVLDRADSLLFTVPTLFYLITLFTKA